MHARLRRAAVTLALLALAVSACGGGDAAGDAEATLAAIMLTPADLGAGYTLAAQRPQTNDEAARARPDTDVARQQYQDWGQLLASTVQIDAPPSADVAFNERPARVTHTAWLFTSDEGASRSLAYVRELSRTVVENFLAHDGAGTRISDTDLVKDLPFPEKGDESFAWRVSGKATFDSGFTTAFVADAVFVRVGNVTGNVMIVSLGKAPDRAELEHLVERFVERAREAA